MRLVSRDFDSGKIGLVRLFIRTVRMTGKVAFLLICWISLVRSRAQYQCDANAPCGCSSVKSTTVVSRIIGGENAQVNSWPWMISLRSNGDHLCGGSILNSQFILTAAHCLKALDSVSSTSILAGSLTYEGSGNDVQIRSVDRIIPHANYDPYTFSNDLGLLRLKTPLNLTGTVLKPICLPNASRPLPDDNATMIGIGWGVTSINDWTAPPILQQVTVRSMNRYLFGCPLILYHPQQQFCAGLPNGGKGPSISTVPSDLILVFVSFRYVSR